MNNINTRIDLSQEVARTYVIEKDSTEVDFTSCNHQQQWPQQRWQLGRSNNTQLGRSNNGNLAAATVADLDGGLLNVCTNRM
jgi:hypothetical protein